MPTDDIPSYSSRGEEALPLLYEDLQDIFIFVEDSSLKEFYNTLLRNILENENVSFYSIIPFHDKNHINHYAQVHSEVNYCFIVDGDFDYLFHSPPLDPRVLQLSKYCIENYLIDGKEIEVIAQEQLYSTPIEEVRDRLQWAEFVNSISRHVRPLYKTYAVCYLLSSGIKNVKSGLRPLCVNGNKLSKDHILQEKKRVALELLKKFDKEEVKNAMIQANNVIEQLDSPLDVISGKAILLPLLAGRLCSIGCGTLKAHSLQIRLLNRLAPTAFEDIRRHIQAAIRRIHGED